MILDQLENWKRYAAVHPGFTAAFEFLNRNDLATLSAGRHPMNDDRRYAIVIRENGKGRDNARLEIHRLFIDIQFTVAGTDHIGWNPFVECTEEASGYNRDKDVAFFSDRPDTWLVSSPTWHVHCLFS
ncbi:MAG: YhcH/YjgK/YiaL family protein [Desulfobacteraceae bacterium]|nr:MAG: YhcH/YjgK/YiaL family protein [Desulfobacteraceae bacterium]